jgi:hypothetical protein
MTVQEIELLDKLAARLLTDCSASGLRKEKIMSLTL